MAELKHFHATDSAEAIAAEILRSGGVIIDGLVEPELLGEINRDFDPLIDEASQQVTGLNPMIAAFFGDKVRHICGLAGKSQTFADQLMCHPLLLALCDQILLPNCADYRLNLAHLMDRGPGSERQLVHRDQDIWVHYRDPKPELQLATMIAMVDFTRENGATCIVPGSHQWPAERQPEESEFAFAEMKAGSAAVYLGSVMHAGGTNATDKWRRGVHMSYCLGWLRTEENNVLAVPAEQASKLSRRARELLGYGVHDAIEDMGGYLGMVDLQNPADLLEQQ